MEKKKFPIRLIIILATLFILVLSSILVYVFVIEKFYVKTFKENITIEYLDEFKSDSGSVCYGSNIRCKKVEVSQKGNVDTSTLGDYKVTYTYKYKNRTLKKVQNVKVVDTTKPVIEVEDVEFVYCPNGSFKDYVATASDNYDGDISSNIKKELVDGQIVFSVSDSSGNQTIIKKEATKKDSEAPKITLKGEKAVYVALNGTYKEAGATASDNCDNDLSSKIVISGSVDTSKNGEYTITYKVKASKYHKLHNLYHNLLTYLFFL